MTPKLDDMVAHVLAHLDTNTPRTLIALAGVPGAGKSTLVARLAKQIGHVTSPDTVVALGMDGFHLPKAALSQFPDPDQAFARRGAPWTFDANGLRDRLDKLRQAAGRADVPWPGFEHERGDPVEGATVVRASTRVVIVEGLYLLHDADGWDAVSASFDERWFLDVPVDVAMNRLARRHMHAWGWSRAAAEARIRSNDRLNAQIVVDSSHHADHRLVQTTSNGVQRITFQP